MGRPYGKIKKKPARMPKSPGGGREPLRVKLRGKDNAPLSMKDVRQGLYETARALEAHAPQHRAKWATLYLVLIDEDGNEVALNAKNELVIYPYKCAAEEYGE
jgi:hypothetical protein